MFEKPIETRLVYGFLDAGKTTYIQECIQNDYFYKYGTTLILCFEQGETPYDQALLSERRTTIAYYDGDRDIRDFCLCSIEDNNPDRIYVEMNTMTPGLRQQLPPCMQVGYAITWIDWATLPLYYANIKQLINQMVSDSQQVIFRGCPSRELLAPYSQGFRVMNQQAVYLRQDPMGYHERAFDLFLPYSLDSDSIEVAERDYLAFCLDAADHPEHYDGKRICFPDPVELRHDGPDRAAKVGRVVMTCCMADLQFMGFPLTGDPPREGWFTLEAQGCTANQGGLLLAPERLMPAKPSATPILSAGVTVQSHTNSDGVSQDMG